MKRNINTSKILIIEDDIFVAELLLRRLGKNGLDCISVADAEIALNRIEKEKPDLILLDIMLPGMDGYKFLQIVKANKKTTDIPVIILSNLGDKTEIAKGLKLGAEDFLVKANLNLGDVIQKIKKTLGEIKN